MRRRASRSLIVAATYVAAMAFYVYAIADPNWGYGSDAWGALITVALALLGRVPLAGEK